MARFDKLAAFFSEGRKLTQTGWPTLSDARELIATLGLEEQMDPEIGGRVFKTTTSAELPELSFSVLWATKAGALRKKKGKLSATAGWPKLAPDERLHRAARALVALGPLTSRYRRAWPAFQDVAEVVDKTFPALIMRLAEGPLPYGQALDELMEHLLGTYRWYAPWDKPDHLRRSVDDCLSETCRLLQMAGLVERRRPGSPGEAGARLNGPGDRGEEEAGDDVLVPTTAGSWLLGRLDIPANAPPVYMPLMTGPGTVHELRVSLDGIDPEIWRTVVVPSGVTLAGLHYVLQAAMGWTDSHLHQFEANGQLYGEDDEEWGTRRNDERRVRLAEIAGAGESFRYDYDFGDSWEHTVQVVAVRPVAEGEQVPRCTGGARACPPEDVGGWPGYADMVAALADPSSDEREGYLEWCGGSFDPEHFDLDRVNGWLSGLRKQVMLAAVGDG